MTISKYERDTYVFSAWVIAVVVAALTGLAYVSHRGVEHRTARCVAAHGHELQLYRATLCVDASGRVLEP
jgi:hypothetical protein